MILQIQEISQKLLEYGVLGFAVTILGWAVTKLYVRNMALVERTLKMLEDKIITTDTIDEEYKTFLKTMLSQYISIIDKNSKIIEEYTIVHKELLDFIDSHLKCSYNNFKK